MKRKRLCGWLLACCSVLPLPAAVVDTLQVNSARMGRAVPTVVVSPDSVTGEGAAVVYLLHGYGGDEGTWLALKPELRAYADRDNLIFVCPDGENSWYWDSPLNPDSQFETFVSRELVDFIDSRYRTLSRRESRAITGFSMGGHGALWLAMRHKDVFGAAGSTSGGLDISPFPDNWKMKEQIGDRDGGPCNWDEYAVVNQTDSLQDGDLRIIFDCGYDDFFFEVNNAFHRKLLEKGVMHDFIVRPGGHTQEYWSNAIDYQLLFFKKRFSHPQSR